MSYELVSTTQCVSLLLNWVSILWGRGGSAIAISYMRPPLPLMVNKTLWGLERSQKKIKKIKSDHVCFDNSDVVDAESRATLTFPVYSGSSLSPFRSRSSLTDRSQELPGSDLSELLSCDSVRFTRDLKVKKKETKESL